MFEADTVCINCEAELMECFSEDMSISEYSLSPVFQQRTYYVDKDGTMYCPKDEEGIVGEHIPEGEG